MKLYLLAELFAIAQSYHIHHSYPKQSANKINRQKPIINNNDSTFHTILSKLGLVKDERSVELDLLQNTGNLNIKPLNNDHQFIFKIFSDDNTRDLSNQSTRINILAPTPTTSSPMSQAATRILAQELAYTQLESSRY
ncbi:hypothetical protein CONCODRAFT_70155 [Conidiobolus coronatus NRRL 28638]|uniref:Uncharacterized protein n=1 Tax=Conidiobolus coronatus (strain ATCC 28846 / CBS 209.66 / NRRL 28638) TaxID=796925 RepID=A0A137P7W8_CONC2|nr:hypothetical protein CONCODRAFT_70155 [Conidiobolus coronatus NRRL 28638]|eukprot:KXN71021.1 hypothetical protein CONCODRAFT_70155 [Conidiobolus coronatus NRRL 28638]